MVKPGNDASRPARGVLYAVICAAAPAVDAGRMVRYARRQGWDVWVIATRAAVDYFLTPGELESISGHPVHTGFRRLDEPGRLPRATAAVVAPATYNTINKWAAGIADNLALSTLAEFTGAKVPTAVLPFVNKSFAATIAFRRSVDQLRSEGIRILLGPNEFEPYPRGGEDDPLAGYPWHRVVAAVADALPSPD